MNLSSRMRQLLVEAAMLLGAVVLTSTAIYIFKADAELAKSRQREEELSRNQDKYFISRYREIAREVETSTENLQKALADMVRIGPISKYNFRLQHVLAQKWLEPQKDRLQLEQFQTQKLMSQLAVLQTNPTDRIFFSNADLASLLENISQCYNDYLEAANRVLDNADAAVQMGETVDADQALSEVHNAASKLLALAADARRIADAIEAYSKSQPPVTARSSVLRWLLLGGLLGLFVLFLFACRCLLASQLRLELIRREAALGHENRLAHFSQLASYLAHEIRNPLTAIIARLYTLQRALTPNSPEYNDAAVIRNEVRRLDQIVQDFLARARPPEPRLAVMSARPLLMNLQELLAAECTKRSIELKVDGVTDARFKGDEAQLKQVLINLVQNSMESMEHGGTITLRARKDGARLKGHAGGTVVIEVQDTGPGIPPEVQEHLFDPFFSTKKNGTGLGLCISSRIVAKHNGELKFETHPGRGTTFSIVLPLAEDQTADAERQH